MIMHSSPEFTNTLAHHFGVDHTAIYGDTRGMARARLGRKRLTVSRSVTRLIYRLCAACSPCMRHCYVCAYISVNLGNKQHVCVLSSSSLLSRPRRARRKRYSTMNVICSSRWKVRRQRRGRVGLMVMRYETIKLMFLHACSVQH